jgi:hypothetical protein
VVSAAPDARTSFGVTGIRTESLPRASPFPGNGISGPEKNAQKRPANCNDAVSENEPSHRSPPIRGLSYTFRKSPVAHDCVVGPGEVPGTSSCNGLERRTLTKAPIDPKRDCSAVANPPAGDARFEASPSSMNLPRSRLHLRRDYNCECIARMAVLARL